MKNSMLILAAAMYLVNDDIAGQLQKLQALAESGEAKLSNEIHLLDVIGECTPQELLARIEAAAEDIKIGGYQGDANSLLLEAMNQMQLSVCKFEYQSSKGPRIAFGTLDKELIAKLNCAKELDALKKNMQSLRALTDLGQVQRGIHDLLNPEKKPSKPRKANTEYQTYYDVEKAAFRMFGVESIIRIF